MATTTNLGKVVITPRGTYSPSTAYVALDIIEYNGSGYLVLAPVTGVTPPNATYYMLLAAKGVKGDTGQAATVTVGTVGSLPAGSTPTVTNTGTANNAIFNFSLTQGNNWYTGNAITGTRTTPTSYATGITLAGVGDLYLNPSITADQGNIYQCTTGGNAATARWIYVGNIVGTAAGSVSYTAQTPTTGQKAQARANIDAAALDGNGKVTAAQIPFSPVVASMGTTYTLALSDAQKTLLTRNTDNVSGNYVITIPSKHDVDFPIGTEIAIVRYYAGAVTITAAAGVYLYYPGSARGAGQVGASVHIAREHSVVALKKLFADYWLVTGDIEE